MKLIYSLTLVAVFFVSCKKNEEDLGAKTVEIVFTEPQVGDTIASYNQVHIEGTISGDGEMNGYTVTASDISTGATIFTKTSDAVAEAYNFHEHWTNNLSDTTDLKISVVVKKDTEGNLETKTTNVVCLP